MSLVVKSRFVRAARKCEPPGWAASSRHPGADETIRHMAPHASTVGHVALVRRTALWQTPAERL
jgi:hypothetical protein